MGSLAWGVESTAGLTGVAGKRHSGWVGHTCKSIIKYTYMLSIVSILSMQRAHGILEVPSERSQDHEVQ